MNAQGLIQRLRQKPFLPFRIKMSDGEMYEVRHPDFIIPARDFLIYPINISRIDEVPDGMKYLSYAQMVELEDFDLKVQESR